MSILTRAFGVHRALRPRAFFLLKGNFSQALHPHDVVPQLSNLFTIPDAGANTPTPRLEPSSPPGSFFLEEPGEEYGSLGKSGSPPDVRELVAKSPETQATETLLRLIAKKDIDAANAAKNEFGKLGIEIRPDIAFADVAVSALSNIDPKVRARDFVGWWSITALKECPEKIAKASGRLMKHPYDLPLLMDFSVICVKAGFMKEILTARLFPHIFRFGNPHATSAFLLKLEDAAKKHCRKNGSKDWMAMRNLAIRIHYLSGRHRVGAYMYGKAIGKIDIEDQTRKLMESAGPFRKSKSSLVIPTSSMRRYGVGERVPSPTVLASELRLLRRAIRSGEQPPHFETLLADFMSAYELTGRRERALRMLRREVFKKAPLAVRVRWVAGEQLFYSAQKRPLASLRTFARYCLADHVLVTEVMRLVNVWTRRKTYRKRCKDWHFANSHNEIGWKIWPSNLCLNLAWKAVLQLSSKKDIGRLYSLLVAHTEAAHREAAQLSGNLHNSVHSVTGIQSADKYYYDSSSEIVSVAPAVFPDESFFHHFVVAFATRVSARRAGEVLADMQRLGLKLTKDDWGTVAGAYARSGDMKRVTRVLDHIDASDNELRAQKISAEGDKEDVELNRLFFRMDRTTRITYNSVIRGFTNCGMYTEARAIQKRMHERGFFAEKVDKRLRGILHRLSRAEKGKPYHKLWRRPIHKHRVVHVDGRPIYVVEDKVDWISEGREAGAHL